MGLLNWLSNIGKRPNPSLADGPVVKFILLDENPGEKSTDDYRLLIGPEFIDNSVEWFAYRCTKNNTRIPEGTKMFIFEQGAVISDQNTNIQMNLAQLVQPENIDEDEEDRIIIDFPKKLCEMTMPEFYHVEDEELHRFLLSIKMNNSPR